MRINDPRYIEKPPSKNEIIRIVLDIEAGRIKLHEIPDNVSQPDKIEIRRIYLSRINNVDLSPLNISKADQAEMADLIENIIGAVKIPIGVAGPMIMQRRKREVKVYVPLATSEGSLIASVNRGISICNQQGGINTEIIADSMTRAPIFKGRDARHVKDSINWIKKHINILAASCKTTSSHCKLNDVQPFQIGNILNLRFVYSTGEAMGMNMTTFAAEECSRIIAIKTGLVLLSIAGNMCSDKKPSAINTILGRGKTVSAWIKLDNKIIEKRLRTSINRFVEVIQNKIWLGSAYAHSLSFNAHTANVVAAIFAATGQDLAQIVESSNSFVWIEQQKNKILFYVQLQSLEIGTIGGGTSLAGPSALLKLMGCRGAGSSRLMAEIICAAVLAGEISYLGALAAGEAVNAHRRFGRGMVSVKNN